MPPLHKTLVAVATYNERDNVDHLVQAIRQALPNTDILIIDDGSPDGTGQWCEDKADEHEWFHLIQRGRKQGLGSATVRGMQFAIEHKYALWIAMDADFSHPPERLPEMVSTIGKLDSPDFDCVIGSRYINGGPRDRLAMGSAVDESRSQLLRANSTRAPATRLQWSISVLPS